MGPIVPAWPVRATVCLSLLLGRALVAAATAGPTPIPHPPPLATNLLQLHSLAAQSRRVICSVELDATVCACNAAKDLLVLQDPSAADLLQLELHGQPFNPGQQVRLKAARCLLTLADCGLKLRAAPVVDNDGMHAMTRRTGTVYLKAGPHRSASIDPMDPRSTVWRWITKGRAVHGNRSRTRRSSGRCRSRPRAGSIQPAA